MFRHHARRQVSSVFKVIRIGIQCFCKKYPIINYSYITPYCIYRPGVVYTFQALSEEDQELWLDAMDGKEPMYVHPPKPGNAHHTYLDEAGFSFATKCFQTLEKRGKLAIKQVLSAKLQNTSFDFMKSSKHFDILFQKVWKIKAFIGLLALLQKLINF